MEQITVYVPTEKDIIEDNVFRVVSIGNAERKQGYFFTPEELEEVIGGFNDWIYNSGYNQYQVGIYRKRKELVRYTTKQLFEQYIKSLK
jgi:hypothetical protein